MKRILTGALIASLWALSWPLGGLAWAESSAIDQYSESVPTADGKGDRNPGDSGGPHAANDDGSVAVPNTSVTTTAPVPTPAAAEPAAESATGSSRPAPEASRADRDGEQDPAASAIPAKQATTASTDGLSVAAIAALMLGSLALAVAFNVWSRRRRGSRVSG